MANTVKKLARGAITASEVTQYTVPASTTAVVTNIVITNTTAAAITATVKLATVDLISSATVAANGILAVDLKQVLNTTETITAQASTTGLRLHISGMEIA
jgi:hypothetical protein